MPPSPIEPGTLPARYFDDLYGRTPDSDPWRFRTSAYEAAKYAATLGRLPRSRYASALEVGCSVGVFTRLLADRADRLLAIDVAPLALDAARDQCRDRPNVRFERLDSLVVAPEGPFDLIVVAEVAYYWTPGDCHRALNGLIGQLTPGGHLILVHWRAPVPDYPQSGDAVHALVAEWATAVGLHHQAGWVDPEYRTDLYEQPTPDSG